MSLKSKLKNKELTVGTWISLAHPAIAEIMVKAGFDWVLMGLGVDGHTASLFPGQEALINPQGFCDVAQHPETNQKRITMTVPGFQCAKHITYHIVGSQKSKVVSELISESSKSKKYPASQINGEW